MNDEIKFQIEEAKRLNNELKEIYERDLQSQNASVQARSHVQDILVKLRSAMDQSMHCFFDKEIAPNLSQNDSEKAKIYFPIVTNKGSLKSTLGRGKMNNLSTTHQPIFSFIDSIQPYNSDYKWLENLSKYSNERHIRLTPQKRYEQRRTIVTGRGGSVSWTEGVTFGPGVSIMGAPVNQLTQNIEPTPGLESRTEIWVSFLFEGSNINVLSFCQKSIEGVEKILEKFFTLF